MRFFSPLLMVLVLLVALAPALAFLWSALFPAEGGQLHWFEIGGRRLQLLARSLLVAGTATVLALFWGVATGLTVSRLRGAPRVIIEMLCYLPLFLPNIVVVMGWTYLLGSTGYLTRGLQWLFGLERAPVNLYSPLGAGFVLSLCCFPFVTVFSAQGFRSVAVREARAAELVAGAWRRLWGIWRPQLAPYLATWAFLVFVVALADHAVPSALMVNVYPVEILAQLTSFQERHEALAVGVLPLFLVVTLWLLRHLLVRPAPFATLEGEVQGGLACPRPVLVVACTAVLLSTVLPLLFLGVTAGEPEAYVRALKTAGDQVLESLEAACWGAPLLMLLGFLFAIGYRACGRRSRLAGEAGAYLLLAIPGAVVGLGLLSLRDLWPWSVFRDDAAIVGYASVCRYLAFPALILGSALSAVRPRLLEAGALSGAGAWRIGSQILLPVLLPALLASAALSFALVMGELSAAVVVYPPGGMTLPVRLASLLHFGADSIVAALCLMVSAFVIGLLLLSQLLTNRGLRVELHDKN